MKKIAIIALIWVCLIGCETQQENPQKLDIVAKIDGWGNDTITVYSYGMNAEKFDTIIAQNGRFEINCDTLNDLNIVVISRPKDLFNNRFRPKAKSIETIIFKGEKTKILGHKTKNGIEFHDTQFKNHRKLNAAVLPLLATADSLDMAIESKMVQNPKDTTIQKLFDKRGEILAEIRQIHCDFITQNPGQELAAYLTATISTTVFMECYGHLSEEVKNGKYKPLLDFGLQRAREHQKYIEALNSSKIEVGQAAPNFALNSNHGKSVELTDFEGRWVILYFWGSWCGWCVKEIPALKKFHAQHKNQLEIIAIACNDTPKNWQNAIEKHSTDPFVNLLDNRGVAGEYAISGFPTKILVDPRGVIRHIAVGNADDYYAKIAEIISN